MPTLKSYNTERRYSLLKFMSLVKGRRIKSINEAVKDIPMTLRIARRLSNEELTFLIEDLEKRLGV